MGQTASDVYNTAAKQNEEAEKKANDALNTLATIAKDKLDLFKNYVEGGTDSKEVPIDLVSFTAAHSFDLHHMSLTLSYSLSGHC